MRVWQYETKLKGVELNRAIFAIAILLLGASHARAQMTPAPGQRLFDLVSGIVFACGMQTGHPWAKEACFKTSADFKKRAEAAKVPFADVLITADFSTKKGETLNGFDHDKAVRVFFNFTESNGSITASLRSTRIWEPTTKEIPGAAPGQRISVPFYIQSMQTDSKTSMSKAQEYLTIITDSFFMVGENRQ
jgi:hypothetical protein